MLFTLSIILALAVLALLVYAASRPDTFRIERRQTIQAPRDLVFPLINDFQQWPSWSPWEKLDPNMKRSYSGPLKGPGAQYRWEGSGKVGAGAMEITESSPPNKLTIKLDFMKPFEAHNIAEFLLTPNTEGCTVTWSMAGPSPFVSKLMGVFMNMDQLIGKDFETGLSNLRAQAEKAGSDKATGGVAAG